MFDLNQLLRDNIRNLQLQASARDAFKGDATLFLNANENAFGSPVSGVDAGSLNRYPDPLQVELKERLSKVKGVPAGNIFIGNGSDEVIDLLFRSFCNPGKDNVIVLPPARALYAVRAHIQDVEVREVALTNDFQPDAERISEAVDERTKLLFISSPNNPTGNSIEREDVEFILNNFEGIVVIDEAYINYSRQRSFISELTEYPNLVVVQTLSHAWGLAGVRVGMAYASDAIIAVLNTVKIPYNISAPAQELALSALNNIEQVNAWIRITVQERAKLTATLGQLLFVKKIYPSDANFLLVKMENAAAVYSYLTDHGIVVRDVSGKELCGECLRITVGTPEENERLIDVLTKFTRSSR
jgi:histidinol-phosphate aminotransferase